MIQCFKTSKHGTKSLKLLGPKNKNHLSKCQLFIRSKNISKLGLGRNEDAMSLQIVSSSLCKFLSKFCITSCKFSTNLI